MSASTGAGQIRLGRTSPAYCRVTFDNPPLNVATQSRLGRVFDLGFHKPGDAENHLGAYLGRLGS